jgi:predicted nucleic acid-binding Zn finger protein
MMERTIYDGNVKTQSLKAIKAFLTWKGRAVDPMPSVIEFMQEEGRMVLVLSNKKDAYYVVTSTRCSCPSAVYRGAPCKHIRKHFPQEQAATVSEAGRIKPEGAWPHDMNGPVVEILG